MSFRGSIDNLSMEGASGWIVDSGQGRPLVVQALLNGRIVGEALAEMHRPDLAAAGLGDGYCGFHIYFSDAVDALALPFVAIKPQGCDVELPRTNLTGFAEYFRSVFARFPGAGRPRSVFGGLWTDRTDAARLLQGRIATGATPADISTTLSSLIQDGHALLKSALAPIGFGPAELPLIEALDTNEPLNPQLENAARRLLEALPGVIFRDVVLRVLRAVLDDIPLAYRATLTRGSAGGFSQSSAAEPLTSPAECIAVIGCAGQEPVLLDIIRGSHQLPEFTGAGVSRWLSPSASGAVEMAVGQALTVEQVLVGPLDLALVGPGTLYRLGAPEGSTAVTTWCAPARVSPTDFLTANAGTFTVRHFSGAALTI